MEGKREILQAMSVRIKLECCMGNRKLCGCSSQRGMEGRESAKRKFLWQREDLEYY